MRGGHDWFNFGLILIRWQSGGYMLLSSVSWCKTQVIANYFQKSSEYCPVWREFLNQSQDALSKTKAISEYILFLKLKLLWRFLSQIWVRRLINWCSQTEYFWNFYVCKRRVKVYSIILNYSMECNQRCFLNNYSKRGDASTIYWRRARAMTLHELRPSKDKPSL